MADQDAFDNAWESGPAVVFSSHPGTTRVRIAKLPDESLAAFSDVLVDGRPVRIVDLIVDAGKA